jgi:hypothetical protein
VIFVMTDKGFNSLLSTSFKIGGDASIAAGPIGAGAKSDITADLIAFTRAKGVYGGLNLDGTVVHANTAWNDAYYNGKDVLPPDILIRKTARSPKSSALLAELNKTASGLAGACQAGRSPCCTPPRRATSGSEEPASGRHATIIQQTACGPEAVGSP